MIGTIILKSLMYAFWAIMVGLLFIGIGRKVTARIQKRYGPPFYQQYMDVIKLLTRKSISHNYVMIFAAIMALGGLVATALFIPVAGHLPYESNGPIFLILYLMAIGYLGMAMAVSGGGNPNAPLGIGRALTLMFGYELPLAAILVLFIGITKSSFLVTIAADQTGSILNWNIFRYPLAFLAMEITVQALMAEKPFDQMIAPAEIASGPLVEMGGKFLGLGMIQMAVAIFIETGLVVNLFLGGASTIVGFTIKQFAVFFVAMCVNAIMPRLRIEQAVIYLWTVPLGLALLQMLIVFVF